MTLTVTLELTPLQEKQLRAGIAQHDKLQVRQLLTDALEPTIANLLEETEPQDDEPTWYELSEMLWAEVQSRLPSDFQPLSDYAMTREAIYDDHP